jgi:hypothetical protein
VCRPSQDEQSAKKGVKSDGGDSVVKATACAPNDMIILTLIKSLVQCGQRCPMQTLFDIIPQSYPGTTLGADAGRKYFVCNVHTRN